jgi:hypothetical protein
MTAPRLGVAFPTAGTSSADTVRQNLALGLANVIAAADDIQDIDYSTANQDAVPDVIIVRDTLICYARDPDDSTSVHDGVAILVSDDGVVFKATLAASAFVNVLDIVNAPTGAEVAGDKYIVGTAPTGDFAGHANKLSFLNGAGDWVFVSAEIGQVVYVEDEEGHYHWSAGATWDPGLGLTTLEAGSVTPRELDEPWGATVVSETNTPAGTRATGGTPTVPLGGTAANINDDNTATASTTSALGNLTAVAVGSRIVAKIDYGSAQDLAAIEVKQVKGSAASSSNAMGLYYSTDGTSWTQLGSGFTLSTTAADVRRSGTFSARYVALVTEAKNWGSDTHTLTDLNGYKQTTSLADGFKYIVAANGFGLFSGHDTQVAVVRNGIYEFYTPYEGARVYDAAVNLRKSFDGSAWNSEAGSYTNLRPIAKYKQEAFSWSGSNSVGYVYDPSILPTSTQNRIATENITLTVAAEFPYQWLEVEYSASVDAATMTTGGAADGLVAGIFVDSETNARDFKRLRRDDWVTNSLGAVNVTFEFQLGDVSNHTLTVVLFPHASSSITGGSITLSRRRMTPRWRASLNRPTGDDLDPALGTLIGNMTSNGGLRAAFNCVATENQNACSMRSAATAAYVGRSLPFPAAISKATIHGSNDSGYVSGGTPTVTISLYGKTGASAPSSDTDGTLLGTITFTDGASEATGRDITSSDTTTEWSHLWARVSHNASATEIYVAELRFLK